ncbi:MAG: hypothetical protein K6G80_00040 [Treponema sp.]|nr:hypothetical protein [Treponema sp.]
MAFTKIVPKARSGITGMSVEADLIAEAAADENDSSNPTCWINPPERVAAVTVAVHKKSGYEGDIEYSIECTCNTTSVIGEDGSGGYWDCVESDTETYTADKVFMLTNCVTGIRVTCLSGKINVAFVG